MLASKSGLRTYRVHGCSAGWALCGHGRPRERQAAACSSDDEEAASDTDTADKPNNADSCAAVRARACRLP